jgi:hypothetical protein
MQGLIFVIIDNKFKLVVENKLQIELIDQNKNFEDMVFSYIFGFELILIKHYISHNYTLKNGCNAKGLQ